MTNNLYFIFNYSLGWYFIFGLILISIVLSSLILSFRPKKNKKKHHQVHKKPKKTNTSNKIRSEKHLLTLPLKELNWREFERLCYLYYKSKGMNPRETKSGADGGVDLLVYSKENKQDIAIQIKHWKNKVTVKEIRELNSSKRNYNCILADFITSSEYTEAALREAKKLRIETYTAGHILHWREQQVKKAN